MPQTGSMAAGPAGAVGNRLPGRPGGVASFTCRYLESWPSPRTPRLIVPERSGAAAARGRDAGIVGADRRRGPPEARLAVPGAAGAEHEVQRGLQAAAADGMPGRPAA